MRWVVPAVLILLVLPGVFAEGFTVRYPTESTAFTCYIEEPGSVCTSRVEYDFGQPDEGYGFGIWGLLLDGTWTNDIANYQRKGSLLIDWTTLDPITLVAYRGCYAGFDPYKRTDCDAELQNGRATIRAECQDPMIRSGDSCVCGPDTISGEKTYWDGNTCVTCDGIWDGQCNPYPSCGARVGDTKCENGQQSTCENHPLGGTYWTSPANCENGCTGNVCSGGVASVGSDPGSRYDSNNIRAQYATTLIDLALLDGNEYIVDCGDASVLNTPQYVSDMIDPKAVCVLQQDKIFRGVMFARSDQAGLSEVIEHLVKYNNQEIDNPDIITQDNIRPNACDNWDQQGNTDWYECPDAVTGLRYDVRVYVQPGDPVTYFVTYEWEPKLSLSIWDSVVRYFMSLLGLISIYEGSVDDFSRGYFAHVEGNGERTINAVLRSDDPDEPGQALLMYDDFSFNIGELTSRAWYLQGADHRQVLAFKFDDITIEEWKGLTSALRLTPNGKPAYGPAVTCGNGVVDFVELCEGSGSNFISPYGKRCEDIGWGEGPLTCIQQTCSFDRSQCISCEDKDGDGYYTAVGQIPALRAVRNDPVLGALNIGMYDQNNQGYTAARAARAQAGIEAQAIPFPFQPFIDQLRPDINAVADGALQDFRICILSKTENACYDEILSSLNLNDATRAVVDVLGKNLQPTALCSNEYCTPLQTGSLGYFGSSYNAFLTAAEGEGVTPLFILDPGEFSNRDFGSAPSNQNFQFRLRLAVACAAVAKATNGEYIYLSGPRGGSEQYAVGYNSCRAGINAVSGSDLYFNGQSNQYVQYVYDNAEPGIIDGILTSNPEQFVTGRWSDFRAGTGAKLLVATDVDGTIPALRASADYIIVGYGTTPTELSVPNEIISHLTQAYTTPTPGEAIIVANKGSPNTVYVRSDFSPSALPYDFTACQPGDVLTAVGDAFFDEGVSYDDIADGAPQGTYKFDIATWNCFGANTLKTCSEELDCNDNNAQINPGATEVCGDGIDSDCSGGDGTPGLDCGSQPGGDYCDFDGTCEYNEDHYTCADCTKKCPAPEKLAFTQGSYDFGVSIDANGRPQLHITTKGTCQLLTNKVSYGQTATLSNSGGSMSVVAKDYGWDLSFSGSQSNSCWQVGTNVVVRSIKPLDYVGCTYDECPCSSGKTCLDLNDKDIVNICV